MRAGWRWPVVVAVCAASLCWMGMAIAAPQTGEEEEQLEERYRWRETGRLWDSADIANYKERILNAEWSSGAFCGALRTNMLNLMDTQRWAGPRGAGGEEGRTSR